MLFFSPICCVIRKYFNSKIIRNDTERKNCTHCEECRGKRVMIAAQQFIFALRPPNRLKGHATEIKVKLNLKKKIIILGIVPNGHLGASHDFVHLLLFVGVLSIPNSTFQGIPLLCCAWSFSMHHCVCFLYQLMLEMSLFMWRKAQNSAVRWQKNDRKHFIYYFQIFITLWMNFLSLNVISAESTHMYVSVLFCAFCLGKWPQVPLQTCLKVSPFSFWGSQIWRFVTAPDAEGIPSASVSNVLSKGT